MSPWTRYLLIQVPGWIITFLVAMALRHWFHLPIWICAGMVALSVLKDFLLYPLVKTAYEGPAGPVTGKLVGEHGVTRERLDPQGYVMIGGELWRAKAAPGTGPIEADTSVRVEAVDGLKLVVGRVK